MRDDHQQLERLARLIEEGLAGSLSRRELIRRGLALGLGLPAIGAALAACGAQPPAGDPAPVSNWRPPQPTPAAGLSGRAEPRVVPAAPTAAPAAPPAPTAAPAPAEAATPEVVNLPTVGVPGARFAVIGDFGLEGEAEAAVAALVAAWTPHFVVSLGDNNYPNGEAATIDRNVGQYYSQYIAPYKGAFGPGAAENRFWPILGNHDWVVGYPEPYLDYFTLPGNGRYYSVQQGPVALFALDSMPGEPDGIEADSPQAAWLQAELTASSAPWKIVLLHHSPYSSGYHGSSVWMRWPFAAWGAHLVLGGHDHNYERVQAEGLTYVVNGLGGGARYAPGFSAVEGSQIFFNADHGAMLIEASATALTASFVTRAGQTVDSFSL